VIAVDIRLYTIRTEPKAVFMIANVLIEISTSLCDILLLRRDVYGTVKTWGEDCDSCVNVNTGDTGIRPRIYTIMAAAQVTSRLYVEKLIEEGVNPHVYTVAADPGPYRKAMQCGEECPSTIGRALPARPARPGAAAVPSCRRPMQPGSRRSPNTLVPPDARRPEPPRRAGHFLSHVL
jgi:hypothetical protein